jgi:hypothetical protein
MIDLNIDDLGVDYQDAGPWRSYSFHTYGSTLEDLWDNATVSEIDQDGGELNCYGASEASKEVYDAIEKIINEAFIEASTLMRYGKVSKPSKNS